MANSTDKSDLARAILAAATPHGSWKGPSAKPSLTVTSECVVALCEYFAQLPIVQSPDVQEFVTEIGDVLKKSGTFITTEYLKRSSDPTKIDGPNSILSLAAYLSICSTEAIRVGKKTITLNNDFVIAALTNATGKLATNEIGNGEIWACTKGMETVVGILDSYPAVKTVFDTISNASTFLETAKEQLGVKILALFGNSTAAIAPYTATIQLDLAMNAPQWAKKHLLPAKLEDAVQAAMSVLVSNFPPDGIRKQALDRKKFSKPNLPDVYDVPIFAALLTGLNKYLENQGSVKVYGNLSDSFYAAAIEMISNTNRLNSKPFVLAHNLRSLSQVDLSSREIGYIKASNKKYENELVRFLESYGTPEKSIANSPIILGDKNDKLFFVSNFWTLGSYSLTILVVILILSYRSFVAKDSVSLGVTAFGLIFILLPIHFVLYKTHHHNWKDKSRSDKSIAILAFFFSYYFLIIPYFVYAVLKVFTFIHE